MGGGDPETICDAVQGRGGSWNADGTIIFAPSVGTGIYRARASGGGPIEPVTALDAERLETSHRVPSFLPDGRHFVFELRSSLPDQAGAYLGSLDGSVKRRLLAGQVRRVIYAHPGYLLFGRGASLMALRFDPETLRVSGEPVPVVDDMRYGDVSVSTNGLLAYIRDPGYEERELVWRERDGTRGTSLVKGEIAYTHEFSDDDLRVAYSRIEEGMSTDIWLMEASRPVPIRFTLGAEWDFHPVWSPDGSRIAFTSARGGAYDVYVKRLGEETDEPLLKTSAPKFVSDWSSDGEYVIYDSLDPETRSDIWVLPMNGAAEPRVFLASPFGEGEARLSPDGDWLAYASDVSGSLEVYVRSFPRPGRGYRASSNGGQQPRWRDDGGELFYAGARRYDRGCRGARQGWRNRAWPAQGVIRYRRAARRE